MEAIVTFNLANKKSALLIPKDAIVTAGENRLVFVVIDGKAVPVPVTILGYYDGDVAVVGDLKPGAQVVIRGNERLKPQQAVTVLK
jgi:multidrug efflux pump subunit AcrA (membrane-fusion protein)